MNGTRLLRFAALTLVASLSLYGGACSSDPTAPEPNGESPDLEGVIYLGETNDEGLEVLLDGKASASPAPTLTAPENGARLTAPTTFTFEAPVTARLEPLPRARYARSFSFAELLGPERLARAHGAPMNGEAFLLTFSTPAEPHLLRVFTDSTSYQPEDEDWATLVAAGEVALTIRAGVFEEGRLPSGAGPFESAPYHFSISGP